MRSAAKTRVLFVDDEPVILELIALGLKSMAEEWETTFAHSAEEALRLMTGQPFDLVVSDMGLPGMNGAHLLNEVMRRFPATIRLILSGHADRESMMKCAGSTHQFLLKPFRLGELKAALKRIRRLKERLGSQEIQKLVARRESLPSVPNVYFQILEALQDPHCPLERIGGVIATDPALTTKLLQLVNSGFLGAARRISTVDEAVLLVGTGTIRSLALTLNLVSVLQTAPADDRSLERVWRHSVRVGQLARQLAQLETADEHLAEEAFTAGLLHDVGKLLLADNPAVRYLRLAARAREENRRLIELERAELQATHAEVGAYLLDLWGLPLPLVEAVAFHHEPSRIAELAFSALTVVHVANVLEAEAAPGDGPPDSLDLPYLDALGVAGRLDAWRQEIQPA